MVLYACIPSQAKSNIFNLNMQSMQATAMSSSMMYPTLITGLAHGALGLSSHHVHEHACYSHPTNTHTCTTCNKHARHCMSHMLHGQHTQMCCVVGLHDGIQPLTKGHTHADKGCPSPKKKGGYKDSPCARLCYDDAHAIGLTRA